MFHIFQGVCKRIAFIELATEQIGGFSSIHTIASWNNVYPHKGHTLYLCLSLINMLVVPFHFSSLLIVILCIFLSLSLHQLQVYAAYKATYSLLIPANKIKIENYMVHSLTER